MTLFGFTSGRVASVLVLFALGLGGCGAAVQVKPESSAPGEEGPEVPGAAGPKEDVPAEHGVVVVPEIVVPELAVEGAPVRYRIPVSAEQPSLGPADAPVTIVEFTDLQCPFCGRVQSTLEQLMEEYPGKIRRVVRQNPLPFHKLAKPAAELVMEGLAQGGAEKYWQLHRLVFEDQQSLSEQVLDGYAEQVGLDMGRYRQAMETHAHVPGIDEDRTLAAKMGARGTPSFFVNGRFMSGAQPITEFTLLVDEELALASKLVGRGVPAVSVYAALTASAHTEQVPSEGNAAANNRRHKPDPDVVYRIPVGKSPVRGRKNALVTIIEIGDFQCPFCGRVQPTLRELRRKYGKEVRIVFRQNPLPFHKHALVAAQAALAAHAQGKFWKMHDLLFDNQTELSRKSLDGYALQAGLNMGKFRRALRQETYKQAVLDDQTLARSLGAKGTPSFFINGRNVRGAQPLVVFEKIIDEELVKAKAMVKAGVSRRKLYDRTIEDGATSPQFIAPGVDEPGAKPNPPR